MGYTGSADARPQLTLHHVLSSVAPSCFRFVKGGSDGEGGSGHWFWGAIQTSQ